MEEDTFSDPRIAPKETGEQLICKPREEWEQQRWDIISYELTIENLRTAVEQLEMLIETKV